MFLSGLGISAAAPQIASFLVQDLGTSLTAAGPFYSTNLTAPVAYTTCRPEPARRRVPTM
jgi:SET family sugar efflux transporter-like MFS transporter